MRPYRVFVSSTATGLGAEREAVRRALERMRGAEFAGMEIFGSREDPPATASLKEVDSSDLYVGIIGGRYGSGITRAEYERAREQRIECLLYIQREEAIRERDADPAAVAERTRWIESITDAHDGHLVTWFHGPGDLGSSVAADVHNWLYRRLAADARRDAVAGAIFELRALLRRVRNREKLRSSLIASGVAVGDDLLDSLVALFPAGGQALLEGIHELPTDYAARIENFLAEYLGSPGSPVPFGGRGEWLAELDAWLLGEGAASCLLVAGEAGRGKSAALVHWSRRWIRDPNVHMVFVPVSIRFRTNLASVFFPLLAARLARVHGDDIASDLNLPVEAWRGVVADFLRRPPRDGRTLVVVIDGLDEAADWEAGPDLFPRRPPDRVRIVVSARLTATTPTHDAWLEQLGWSRRLARPVTLEPLSRSGVREVVVSMGFPLTELGTKVDVVAELHRLSSGDPLMVRLYVDELWSRGAAVVRLVPDDLAAIRPGLEGYFDRWWREQKALWGQAAPLRERGVRAVLNLLAAAFGPLAREDILGLAPADADLTTWTLDDALQPLRRFVIEEPAGLVFSHPRFAQYLMGELTSGEQTALDEQFLAWSAAARRDIEDGSLSPVDTPRYVVLFTGAHLERLGSDAAAMCDLLTPQWRRAWESSDAGVAGFGNDVDRAFRVVRQERRTDLAVFCFLLKASLRSISHRIPATLLRRLLEESIWRPKQAIAYARTMARFPEHVELLTVVSQFVEKEERAALLDEARAAAAALEERDRARALLALVRAGDPADTLRVAVSSWDDIWLAAAKELIESGRLREAEELCGFEPVTVSGPFTRWLIGSRKLDVLRRLQKRRSTVAADAETEWQLLLLGEPGHAAWTTLPHDRVEAARADVLAGQPVRLTTLDLQWLYRLFTCWDFSGVIAEFAYRIARAMKPEMQDVFARMLRQPAGRHSRRAVLLAPDHALEQRIRELLMSGRGIELRTTVEEIMPALCGELLELAVELLATRAALKLEDCRNLVGQLIAADAPAFRRAVAKLDESDAKLMLLCSAADADAEGRPDLVRRIHASLTRRTPTEIFESHLDVAARHLDGTVLRAIVGALSRLSDGPDIELARFLAAPERFEQPPPAAGDDLALLTACKSDEAMPGVLRWLVESAPLRQPAVLDLLVATRTSGDTARSLRRVLWKRMQSVAPAVIDQVPRMQDPPAAAWSTSIPDDVFRLMDSPLRWSYPDRQISLALLNRDPEATLRRRIELFGAAWIAHGPLRHVGHLLTVEERLEVFSANPSPSAILAFGSWLGRSRMHELFEQVWQRTAPEQLCAMLPFVDRSHRELAVHELLSGARIQRTAPLIRDILLGLWVDAPPSHLASMQEAFVAALTPPEILRVTRALANRPDAATLIAGIHRCAPLAPDVLAQVLDVLLDVTRPVTRRAALLDVAVVASLHSDRGDADRHLAMIDRAVSIFA